MGNRAAFGFQDEDDRIVWLYGHDAGHDMLRRLADAVGHAEARWEESSYGTRMMISHMIGEQWKSEYGWGITLDLPDTEHSVPVVNFADQEVWLYPYPGWNGEVEWGLSKYPKYKIGFALFCKKYGSYETSLHFADAKPKSAKPETEELRLTKAEWLALMSTL